MLTLQACRACELRPHAQPADPALVFCLQEEWETDEEEA